MGHRDRRRRAGLLAFAALFVLALVATPVLAGSSSTPLGSSKSLEKTSEAGEGHDEVMEATVQYSAIRTAPAGTVTAGAFAAAYASAAALPVVGGAWSEVTNKPYDNDDPRYRDPFFSNSGAGWGLVTGRATALAVDPVNSQVVYAGFADGGVWRSTNGGAAWTPVFDGNGTLAIGAIAINPADRSVWVGTGEANTAFENYAGLGVFRSATGNSGTWHQVGGTQLENTTIGKLAFDGAGRVYAGTNFGLYRRVAGTGGTAQWTKVLDAAIAGFAPRPYGMSIVPDVVVRPGTGGRVVVANMAWRNGASYNGFYISRDYGVHFTRSTLLGAINPKTLGRSSFAYSRTGGKLYTVVEDTGLIQKPVQTGNSVLAGIYVSNTGDPAGPWNQIADYRKLGNSGSALRFKGFYPGVQAWYNQFIAVDPANDQHVYVGLEEVFETRNGGSNWRAIGVYWNFGFPCYSQANPENCPPTPHPDQHAVAIANGKVYVGNDGGIYSRALAQPSSSVAGWANHNATLRTLQYYSVGTGAVSAGNGHPAGEAYWGGLQDNGQSFLVANPAMPTMVSPFGGDGGDTIVNPSNGDQAVMEYVDLNMWKTTTAGYSPNGTISGALVEISPSCLTFTYSPNPCDPNPRFIAPFEADPTNVNHWVAGGQYLWDNQGKGWATSCSSTTCDWKIQWDSGAGHSMTAVATNGSVSYGAWCSPGAGCNPRELSGVNDDDGFESGIGTNASGTWKQLDVEALGLPNRYVTGLAVDPADPMHVWATYGGFSRRWIPSAGVGHVFESSDGGGHWTNVTGNLPDAPTTDVLLVDGNLVVSSDVGTFVAAQGGGTATSWSRLGTGLPHAAGTDLTLDSARTNVVLATHGRGIWKIAKP